MSVNPQYLAQDWQPTQVPAAETTQSDDVDAQSENVAQVPATETTQSDSVDAQSENVAPMSEAESTSRMRSSCSAVCSTTCTKSLPLEGMCTSTRVNPNAKDRRWFAKRISLDLSVNV